MTRVLLPLFLLVLFFLASGCQGFLDDYSYQPIQNFSSNGNY